ncbi:ppfA [Escherichia coli]|uniref:ppfA n=1 Tax=Escherichia coli TaxID=562 RepID=UPI003D2F25A6
MSFFSTLKTALSLKEKLAATGVLVLICALVGAGFAWERHQLKQAIEKIGSLDQAVKERDKSIMDLNQTIETMNKAEQHFHSQEVKNESEQAKYADRQMEPRQPGGCKLKTAPVRPVAARPAEYVCSEDLFY